jgi:hypothetical protein
MFRKDWSMRPFAKAYLELTRDVSTTQEERVTDSGGEVAFRGFLGDYDLEVTRDGRTERASFSLIGNGGPIEVTLPREPTATK